MGNRIDLGSYLTTMDKNTYYTRFKKRDIVLHDVGGYERYHNMLSLNYCIAHGALLFYDTTKKKSKENVEYWRKKLPNDVPYIIVGNKIDLSGVEEDNYLISCLTTKDVSRPLKDLLDRIPLPRNNPTILEQLLAYLYHLVDFLPGLGDHLEHSSTDSSL
tara:strand:- start:15437 stop:15916 length:480 start_codon:yes stop_codon:yes gene_type:complete